MTAVALGYRRQNFYRHIAVKSILPHVALILCILMLAKNSLCALGASFSTDELQDLDENDWELENDSIEREGMSVGNGEIIDGQSCGAKKSDDMFARGGNNFGRDDNHEVHHRKHQGTESEDSTSSIIKSTKNERYRSRPNHTKKSLLDRLGDIFSQDLIQRISKQIMQYPFQQFRFPQFQFQFHHPWDKKKQIERGENRAQKVNPLISRLNRGLALNHGGLSVDKRNSDIVDFKTSRRAGAWCHPSLEKKDEEGIDDLLDKSIVACLPDPEKALDEIALNEDCKTDDVGITDTEQNYFHFDEPDDDIKPGSVVFVLPSADAKLGRQENDLDHSVIPIEHGSGKMFGLGDDSASEFVATGTRCLTQVGKHYDHDDRVTQYVMLQKEPHEMGNIDIHKKDFAYQPVSLGIFEDTLGGPNRKLYQRFTGNEIEARINPEHEAVEVVSKTQSSLIGGAVIGNQNLHRRLSGTSENNDRQLSFRWWSWVSHLSQFVHSESDGKKNARFGSRYRGKYDHHHQSSYQSDLYEEEGKYAFAGGSYGEVWRARRRCPVGPKSQKMKHSQEEEGHASTASCDEKELIAKRLKIEYGYSILEAGLREVYFGELLAREVESSSLFTTYVDHFFRNGKNDHLELWIVFEHGGQSLRSYLYTPVVDSIGGFMVFQHSSFWRRLRRGIVRSSVHDIDDRARAVVIAETHPHNLSRSKNGERSSDGKEANLSQQKNAGTEEGRHRNNSELEGRVLLKEVLNQIITSVAFLHEHGIVHR